MTKAMILSASTKNTAAITTKMNTIDVVIMVSRRVGQVTLRTSDWTSRMYSTGFFIINRHSSNNGRSGGTRTHDPRFWRPMLYQLSYTPKQQAATGAGAGRVISLLQNHCDDACTDGAAAFADGEAQLLFHRDRNDQFDFHRDIVPRHHHFGARRKLHDP